MRRRQSPGVERALAHVRSVIQTFRGTDKHRLPTISVLAQQASVARATMWKAVRILKSRGLLEASPNRGIVLTPHAAHAETADEDGEAGWGSIVELSRRISKVSGIEPHAVREVLRCAAENGLLAAPPTGGPAQPADSRTLSGPRYKWQILAQRIQNDIARGIYPSGALLPLSKQLTLEYGVCYRTLQKALGLLVNKQVLIPDRQKYRVRSIRPPRFRSTLVLYAARPQLSAPLSYRLQRRFRALEMECSKMDVQLRTVFYRVIDADRAVPEEPRKPFGSNDHAAGNVLGYMIWDGRMPPSLTEELLRSLSRHHRPIAFLDETGRFHERGHNYNHKYLRLFSVGYSTIAGEHAGRYLLRLGHRRVVYISSVRGGDWSRYRLEGLRRVYADAGEDSVLHPLIAAHAGSSEAFPAERLHRPETRVLLEAMRQILKRNESFTSLHPRALERIEKQLGSALNSALVEETLRCDYEPLFEKALQLSDVSAWVLENDIMALSAMDFLDQRGVAVPERISVLGFDDRPNASLRRLSSYNFNDGALVNAMLKYVLEGSLPHFGGEWRERVEIEGFIVERDTTAPAV